MGVYVNQVGYRPAAKKVATVTKGGMYRIMQDETCVAEVEAAAFGMDQESGDEVWQIDFSSVTAPGKYYVKGENEKSVSFDIKEDVYNDLIAAMSKCLYYQRCGCALEEKHAGVYTHKACHTGKSMHYDDFINKTPNPEMFDLQGGWHDAGDFGRYSTAAAVALGHLLYAYELFPESFGYTMNIPETGNGVPDILNECRYELDWLYKMQAPDGGVYHKLTAYRHAPFVMPEEDMDQFLIYPVSSMAVADYVAIMALASRIYRPFDAEFADKAILAARKSFQWLTENGYVGFQNPEGSGTGEYGDVSDKDERLWAAAEMLRTDKDGDVEAYRAMLKKYFYDPEVKKTDFGWINVAGFSLLTLLTDKEHCAGNEIEEFLKKEMFEGADRLVELSKKSGYRLCMAARDYVWGSNMAVMNRGMLLTLANLFAEDAAKAQTYLDAAEDTLHYLLGRNALDRSYVTGFGEKAYKNPHNRPSACDGIEETMPGWVSGGPFRTPADPDAIKMIPAGTPPMKCHADVIGSYSTNEITIYWNSPAIFVTAFLKSDNV